MMQIQPDFTFYASNSNEIGFVIVNNHPILEIDGLPNAFVDEILIFEDNSLGIVTSISNKTIEVASLSRQPLSINAKVVRTATSINIPVGEHLLGHQFDFLGNSIRNNITLNEDISYVDIKGTDNNLNRRSKITQPYYTGVSVVDILLPLGKGQRELVIGDKQVGKTSFLLQLCNFQYKNGGIIIYCCIGKSKSDIKKIEDYFTTNNIQNKVIMFVSESTDSLISIINIPFTAMSVAEWFCNNGHDVTIILDDLTTHAKYYRELSLQSNKFPGRNSYPGDIFHLHAKLLERAGNFKLNTEEEREASITCFPVVDTVENDISGYIQTNVMSITDGHLFFDKDIFTKGRRPPINYFLSVTRVGRQTQNSLRWAINREILSFLTLYDKVQSFVQFGAELNEGTKSTLLVGERLEGAFTQDIEDTMPISLQIMIISLIWLGTWNAETLATINVTTKKMINMYINDTSYASLIDSLVYNADSMNQLLFNINQNMENITKYV